MKSFTVKAISRHVKETLTEMESTDKVRVSETDVDTVVTLDSGTKYVLSAQSKLDSIIVENGDGATTQHYRAERYRQNGSDELPERDFQNNWLASEDDSVLDQPIEELGISAEEIKSVNSNGINKAMYTFDGFQSTPLEVYKKLINDKTLKAGEWVLNTDYLDEVFAYATSELSDDEMIVALKALRDELIVAQEALVDSANNPIDFEYRPEETVLSIRREQLDEVPLLLQRAHSGGTEIRYVVKLIDQDKTLTPIVVLPADHPLDNGDKVQMHHGVWATPQSYVTSYPDQAAGLPEVMANKEKILYKPSETSYMFYHDAINTVLDNAGANDSDDDATDTIGSAPVRFDLNELKSYISTMADHPAFFNNEVMFKEDEIGELVAEVAERADIHEVTELVRYLEMACKFLGNCNAKPVPVKIDDDYVGVDRNLEERPKLPPLLRYVNETSEDVNQLNMAEWTVKTSLPTGDRKCPVFAVIADDMEKITDGSDIFYLDGMWIVEAEKFENEEAEVLAYVTEQDQDSLEVTTLTEGWVNILKRVVSADGDVDLSEPEDEIVDMQQDESHYETYTAEYLTELAKNPHFRLNNVTLLTNPILEFVKLTQASNISSAKEASVRFVKGVIDFIDRLVMKADEGHPSAVALESSKIPMPPTYMNHVSAALAYGLEEKQLVYKLSPHVPVYSVSEEQLKEITNCVQPLTIVDGFAVVVLDDKTKHSLSNEAFCANVIKETAAHEKEKRENLLKVREDLLGVLKTIG